MKFCKKINSFDLQYLIIEVNSSKPRWNNYANLQRTNKPYATLYNIVYIAYAIYKTHVNMSMHKCRKRVSRQTNADTIVYSLLVYVYVSKCGPSRYSNVELYIYIWVCCVYYTGAKNRKHKPWRVAITRICAVLTKNMKRNKHYKNVVCFC